MVLTPRAGARGPDVLTSRRMRARPATLDDAGALARIYNEGIAERTATFETRPRGEAEVRAWFDDAHPILVVQDDAGATVGFAASSAYLPQEHYSGIAEFKVYVSRDARARGAGKLAVNELMSACRSAGYWKLISLLFVDNTAGRALLKTLGFREVGTYLRHGRLDGQWRDVVVVEKFLAPLGGETGPAPPSSRPPREAIIATLKDTAPDAVLKATDDARAHVETVRADDGELLDAVLDAFVAVRLRDATARGRFVRFFATYASLGPAAAADLFERIFGRLRGRSLGADIEVFYEVVFVLKQTLAAVGGRARAPELSTHLPELVAWIEEAIELPRDSRTRISPANLASLLMSLALSLAEFEEQRHQIAALLPRATARHPIEAPASIRPSSPSQLPPALAAPVTVKPHLAPPPPGTRARVVPPPLPGAAPAPDAKPARKGKETKPKVLGKSKARGKASKDRSG